MVILDIKGARVSYGWITVKQASVPSSTALRGKLGKLSPFSNSAQVQDIQNKKYYIEKNKYCSLMAQDSILFV